MIKVSKKRVVVVPVSTRVLVKDTKDVGFQKMGSDSAVLILRGTGSLFHHLGTRTENRFAWDEWEPGSPWYFSVLGKLLRKDSLASYQLPHTGRS